MKLYQKTCCGIERDIMRLSNSQQPILAFACKRVSQEFGC